MEYFLVAVLDQWIGYAVLFGYIRY